MSKKNQSFLKSPLRIAVCGLGLVGRRHVEAIEQIRGIKFVAGVDPSYDGRKFSADRGVPAFSTMNEMLKKVTPDGIILATPTKLHAQQAMECINLAIPVLIEKPIADNLDDARDIVLNAENAGVPVIVGHHRRHNPVIQKAKTIIDDGKIGEIRAIHSTCWFYKPDEYFECSPWRKMRGAGPVSVNSVHDVDLIRFLCGKIISVQAQVTNSQRGYENEDVAAALLRFENNAIGTITVSDSIVAPWSWEMTSKEYPIYPKTSQSSYMIGGSHGSLSIPDLTMWTHEVHRDWWKPISATSAPFESSDPLINQIIHFKAVIEGRESPLVTAREGLKTLEVVAAIQKAAQTLEIVHLSQL